MCFVSKICVSFLHRPIELDVKSVGRLLRFTACCGCADLTEGTLRSISVPCTGMSEIFLGTSLLLTDSSLFSSTTIVPVADMLSPMPGMLRGGLSDPRGDAIDGEVRSAPGLELSRGVELCGHCLGVWLPEAFETIDAFPEVEASVWGLRGGLCSAGFAWPPAERSGSEEGTTLLADLKREERALGLGEPGRTSGAGARLGEVGVACVTWMTARGVCEDGVEGVAEEVERTCLVLEGWVGCEGCEGCEDWVGGAGCAGDAR